MAWNDLDVGGDHAEDMFYVGNEAVDTAAAAYVDIGKCAVEEVVTHVDDVSVLEPDHTISVRMTGWDMDQLDFVIIEMHLQVIIEGNQR